ncbi:cytosolic sulfotransferase 12-like [Syzygium oleosum]|uniref:cytosolic sulfotransferase 12-like n=1 Tax=Syzygium oleosum TaxID=219896 RepID=UPI0024BA53A3|nr:cytosolic sulfotransferase 12-like [Syzygium oleosum]
MTTMQGSQTRPPSRAKYLRDNGMSQACKDLLSSLPSEEDWVAASLCPCQGFWFPSPLLSGIPACQNHFQAHTSDILLVSNPKSDTTWLKAILFALLNCAKYSKSDSQQCHPLLTQNPHDLMPFLELCVEQENPDFAAFASPWLFATHLPYSSLPQSVRDSECKLVYLCRNPKDTFVSLWHFFDKLSPEKGQIPLPDCLDNFCRGMSFYGPYWDHVLGYHRTSSEMPEKVLFMMYEEMKEGPHSHVWRLADFMGCPFSEEELRDGTVAGILRMCSFDNLSALEVNKSGKLSTGQENKLFFRRGEVGDWVNHMSAEMGEKIDGVMEEKLRGSGLKL